MRLHRIRSLLRPKHSSSTGALLLPNLNKRNLHLSYRLLTRELCRLPDSTTVPVGREYYKTKNKCLSALLTFLRNPGWACMIATWLTTGPSERV